MCGLLLEASLRDLSAGALRHRFVKSFRLGGERVDVGAASKYKDEGAG